MSEPPNMIDVKPFRDWELSDLKRFISAPREDPTVNELICGCGDHTMNADGVCDVCRMPQFAKPAPVVAEVRRAPIDLEAIQSRQRGFTELNSGWLDSQGGGSSLPGLLRIDIPDLLAEVARLTAERDDLQEKCTEAFDDAVQREYRYQSLRTRLRGLEQQCKSTANVNSDQSIQLQQQDAFEAAQYSRGMADAQMTIAKELARLFTTPEEQIK